MQHSESEDAAMKRAMNFAVLILNWLQLGEPSKPPANYQPDARLTPEQTQMIQRLQTFFEDWKKHPPVDAASMGRTAAKVESLEEQLTVLTLEAERLTKLLGSGLKPGLIPQRKDETLPPPTMLAKDIEAERLKFSGSP